MRRTSICSLPLYSKNELGERLGFVKDRLLRFGSELIFSLCEQFGIEVVIINKTESSTFEDDLAQDVLEIITVFSARLYGARNHKNKKLLDALKEAAETL